MSDRFKPDAAALVTAGILIAFAWTGIAEMTHQKKGRLREAPQLQQRLPEVDYVRCAALLADGPCAPDPSMQRLNGEPPLELQPMPQARPLDLAPAR
jgi:hypothetical protein